jgi:hypothetical protein
MISLVFLVVWLLPQSLTCALVRSAVDSVQRREERRRRRRRRRRKRKRTSPHDATTLDASSAKVNVTNETFHLNQQSARHHPMF